MENNVNKTVRADLCCGCGVCKAICPKECISWGRKNGLYVPHIDAQQCVNCGLCAAVCPGLGHHYEPAETAEETVTGPALAAFNAWSTDPDLRHVSASGGVVSTLIRELLSAGIFDGAFCLDTYDYRSQMKTRLYTAEEVAANWHQSNAPKSRYLPVSHENAVAYMKANRNARLILIGTSCALRGVLAAIKKLKLNREQYLLIGLFCDKVFNYNVLAYWQNLYCQGNTLAALHFKNKESGGWPGDMKFFPEGQEPFYVPLNDRAKAKAYFMPERCLYCVDKLNACADISLGDNYTGIAESELGSNSVIVRTNAGMEAWAATKEKLAFREIDIADIRNAQAINRRLDNLYCGDLKAAKTDLNPGVPREKDASPFAQVWKKSLQKLNAGAVYDADPTVLEKQIRRDNKKPNPVIRFAKRAIGYVKRRILPS
jgi:coenzyme F420 hydrogenase subunit beta